MNKKPEKINFNFKKVKAVGGQLNVDFAPSFAIGEEAYTCDFKLKMPMEPHEDLLNELSKLKVPLAKVHGLIDIEALTSSSEFEATPAQKKYASNHRSEKLSNVQVTGFSVSGKDSNYGCVITGTYNGQAINSKRIKFVGNGLGFEDEVLESVTKVIDETYEYLYMDKIANPEDIED